MREAEGYTRGATWPALPGAPTSVSGIAGVASVALTWTPPAQTGGLSLTDYVIQYSSNSGTTWTTFNDGTSTATSATITGLTSDTAYIFRVAALNIAGAGNYSAVSAVVTPAAAVIPDLTLTKAAGVTWSGTGTSAAPYAYAAGLADSTVASGANRLTFTVNKKGAFYFSTAYNDSDDDNSSSITILKNGVSVYSPGNINGSTATFSTNFSVTYGDVITFDTKRSFWASGGTYTNTSVYLAPYPVIGTPTNVSVTGGNGQASLSWTAPSSNANLITDYTIQYSRDGGTLWITWAHAASTSTSATVTGLFNGVAHLFRIKAVGTIGGDSGYANASSVTPSGAANGSGVSTYFILNYTGGSWSGSGTAASPYTSSSTFTNSGAATSLPLIFYATADCAVSVTLDHTTYLDDNGGDQTLNYYIDGVPCVNLWHTFTPSGYLVTRTGTQTRVISLLAGQTLTVVTTAGKADTYSNVSVYATAPRASNVEFMALSDTGNYQWTPLPTTSVGGTITGTGTAADKFTFPTPLNYGYVQYGWGAIIIRTLQACTVNYSCGVANVADDNGVSLNAYKIRQALNYEVGSFTYLAYDAGTGTTAISEGQSGTRSFAATANTLYRLRQYGSPGNNITDLKVWTT